MTHPITWRLTPPGDAAAEDALCVVCATHEVVCIALERDVTGHRFPVRFEAGGAPVGLCAACIARMGDALAGWPVVAPEAPDPLQPATSPIVANTPDPADTQPEWKPDHARRVRALWWVCAWRQALLVHPGNERVLNRLDTAEEWADFLGVDRGVAP